MTWEVASVLMFEVFFISNCLEIKFQTVTSSMEVLGVSNQNHVLEL